MAGNQFPPSPTDLIIGRRDWREQLEREYQQTARRLQAAYDRLLPDLRARAQAMVDEYQRILTTTGEIPPPSVVRGLGAYQDLIRRIDAEMQDFAALARNATGELQTSAIRSGIQAAFDATMAQAGRSAEVVAGAWLRPDPAVLERLIGYADSEAMRQNFAEFGENAANNFADGLIGLTAQGKGAAQIARYMQTWFDIPFAWAENMTRTAQNYSYRMSSHAAYRANATLYDGWMWRAALDVRTCLSCISQHGNVYPVTETLNDHHRGRCTPVPVLHGSTWVRDVERGESWYSRLPEGAQRKIAGDVMYLALRDRHVSWRELSRPYDNSVFGTMLREASASELLESRRYLALRRASRRMMSNRMSNEEAALAAARARAGELL